MDDTFTGSSVTVTPHGNVFVAAAFLYGMGLDEVAEEKLAHQDQHFQVIITVKAVKPLD